MADFENRENPIFGRKVFFVNPSFTIKELATKKLREMEYETYIIEDYRYVKSILRHNPDSICLVNLDHVNDKSLTVIQWLNFVYSCETDETLSSIFFGVLSVNTSPKQMNLFFYNTRLPAGYIPASPNKEDFYETLSCILDVNGAKGRRQYVRATCDISGNAYITLDMKNNQQLSLPLVDFSSVGLACQIPDKMCGLIPANTRLDGVSLYLCGEKLKIDLVILKEFKKGEKNVLVTILPKSVTLEVRNKIRNYVFRILQTVIDSQTDFNNPDDTEYSLKFEKKDMVVNMDDLPTAGDLEDPSELEDIVSK